MSDENTNTGGEPVTVKSHPAWLKWLGAFVLGGSILAVGIALIGATLARYDMIDKISGFYAVMMMRQPTMVLAALAVIALVIGIAMKARPLWQPALAFVLSSALLYVIYSSVIWPAGELPEGPPLHDITTDVDDPPAFRALTLREDNLVPFENEEEWRAAHRQSYPDIAPILIDASPEQTLARARALAEERGWEIVSSDPAGAYLEATATAGYVRFYDDVIVEVTPVADGSTRVDMRSVSRVGVSDLGYNATRVEAFLADLREAG